MSNLYEVLSSLRSEISNSVQEVLDKWDTPPFEGGICLEVANSIESVVTNHIHDVGVLEGGHEGDDHCYFIFYDTTSAYSVDISYHTYEYGSGFCWTKKEGVILTEDDVDIFPVNRQDIQSTIDMDS